MFVLQYGGPEPRDRTSTVFAGIPVAFRCPLPIVFCRFRTLKSALGMYHF